MQNAPRDALTFCQNTHVTVFYIHLIRYTTSVVNTCPANTSLPARMKILVVDDHPLIREAMEHVLSELSDNVILLGAGDVRSALELLDAQPDIDLVLLDLSLPAPADSLPSTC